MMRLILALVIFTISTPPVRAQEGIPPLTADQVEALSFPIDPQAPLTRDNHYAVLMNNVRTWGNTMPLWSAQPETAPPLRPHGAFTGVGSTAFAEPGELFLFGARFIRKDTLEGRPSIERWTVNPYDPKTDQRGATPVVIFVDRTTTGRTREPQSGWYIRVAARSYRPVMVESVRGNMLPTHAFVGATFGVLPTPGGDASRYFSFIGIAISVVIAIGIVLSIVITVAVRKGKQTQADNGAA